MREQYRTGMNALDHRALSYGSSLRSVGISGGKYENVAQASGLGEAIVQRRETERRNRKLANARRKHSKRTR